MSHHCIDWIPSELALQCNLLWTLDNGLTELQGPNIWVEHGIPDNNVTSRNQFYESVHYLCSNEYTYSLLRKEGLKAYHTGGAYLDMTIPKIRTPTKLVYVPQHCRMEDHDLPIEWNKPPLTKDELINLCEKYKCDDYITSIIDDTDMEIYKSLNPISSNRFHGLGTSHFNKCRFLYENAKVVYADAMSTFDITAEAHGIKVIGRDSQNIPREYDNIQVLTDGLCKNRILYKIREILSDYEQKT